MNAETEKGIGAELAAVGAGQRSAAAWALLIALQERGISLREEKGELRITQADLGRITPDELATLRHLRHELMTLLQPVAARNFTHSVMPTGRFPLSTSQRRMWDIEHAHGFQSPRLTSAIVIHGAIDVDRLETAFAAVVARHSALRIIVEDVAGEPMQIVRERVSFKLDRFDVRGGSAQDSWARGELVRAEYFARPMALESGEVLRVALVRVDDDVCCLLVCAHHICADGRSMQILRKDLMAFYHGKANEGSADAGIAQHTEHVEWERARLASDRDRLIAYWSSAIVADYAWRELRDGSAPVGPSGAAKCEMRLAAADVARLRRVARDVSATLNAAMLAIVASMLDRYATSLRPDLRRGVNIGIPVSGRAFARFEDVIGFFANTLIVSFDTENTGAGMPALIRHCQRRLGDAMEHQALPFQEIVSAIGPIESARPFQVSFNMMAAELSSAAIAPGMRIATWEGELQAGFFDLRVDVLEDEDGITIRLVHLLNRLSPEYVERLMVDLKATACLLCGSGS